MTKKEQISLTRAITKDITNHMINKIMKGNIPEEWDGFELRHWLKEIVDREDLLSDRFRNKPYRRRKRDCENVIIVNNLT